MGFLGRKRMDGVVERHGRHKKPVAQLVTTGEVIGTCPVCGGRFARVTWSGKGGRPAVYCSPTCRTRAFRLRRKNRK